MMRTGTTVEDIAKDMQAVNYKTLYKIAQCSDKVVGTACTYYRIDNYIEICLFVLEILCLVHQLLYDVCILFGQALAHL